MRSADTLTGRTMCTLNNGTDVPVGTDFFEGPCTRCSCTQDGKECVSTVCPSIGCTPGRQLVTRPGECCPTCGPRKKPTPCSNALTSIMTCRIVLHATLLPNDVRHIGLTSYHVELYCTSHALFTSVPIYIVHSFSTVIMCRVLTPVHEQFQERFLALLVSHGTSILRTILVHQK